MSENKNPLLSIGEVSKSLGITRKIILNYEAKGLIMPDKKGGKTANRYYSADTLARIRTIRVMQNLGLSLDEIKSYYNGTTNLQLLIKRLEILRDKLNFNIEKLKERVKLENDFLIKHTTLSAQTVFRKTLRLTSVSEKAEYLRKLVITAMRNYGSDTDKSMFFIEYPLNDPDLISYCIAIPTHSTGENVFEIPESNAISLFYHGSYESISVARDILLSYAQNEKLSHRGICRHIYLEGPPQHQDPEKFITQVALLIN